MAENPKSKGINPKLQTVISLGKPNFLISSKPKIDKKLQTGIITITAILTYLLCESGIMPNV